MKKLLYIIMFLFLICASAQGATYSYYFSNAGGGTTCSEVSPCATLAVAQAKINAANSDDTVNLYFNKGDTWTESSGTGTQIYVGTSKPIVNIDSYGSGDKPIFDGNVSDFSTAPVSGVGGYYFYNVFFKFDKPSCTIKNVEIKNVYGDAIRIASGTSLLPSTVSGCTIHNIGYCAVSCASAGVSHTLIEKNLVYTCQELHRQNTDPRKVDLYNWASAIHLHTINEASTFTDNLVRYNVVYDVSGEGITVNGGIMEYNIVGDTGSVGVYPASCKNIPTSIIARYNLITMSSSTTYKNHPGGYNGIMVSDESAVGNNASLTIEVYGNIIINRRNGIKFDIGYGDGFPIKEVRIYNNTIIDSVVYNIVINEDSYDMVVGGYIYNNASILYDRTGDHHVMDYGDPAGLSTYWTIGNNAFWDATAGDEGTVDVDWRTNYVTGNPLLYGEETTGLNWDGLGTGDPRQNTNGSEYGEWADIAYTDGSSLIGTGLNISAWDDVLLTTGTDFDNTLDGLSAFVLKQNLQFDIGAFAGGLAINTTGSELIDEKCKDDSSPYEASQNVAFALTSIESANCNYEVKDDTYASPCDGETYATLTDAGGYGGGAMTDNPNTAFEEDVSMNCGITRYVCVRCQGVDPVVDSNPLEITLQVAPGGGVTPGVHAQIKPCPVGETCISIIPCPAGQTCIDIGTIQ